MRFVTGKTTYCETLHQAVERLRGFMARGSCPMPRIGAKPPARRFSKHVSGTD
jgi:hypothetical protein